MIIFIGGPPRVGKTTIAKVLSKKTGFSYISSDNLRETVIYSKIVDDTSLIHTMKNKGEWDNREMFYSDNSTEEIIDLQNKESREVSSLVKAFTRSAAEDSERNFIVEGVALVPSFYSQDFINKYNIFFYCVGNTNFDTFFDYSWKHRVEGDWLRDENKETFEKVIMYCSNFSKFFKEDSNKQNVTYFEIKSELFVSDVEKIVNKIIHDTGFS